MMKQYAVIGLGRFGFSVVNALSQKGAEVLAIDSDEEMVDNISDIATFAVQCDATDSKALMAVSTQNVDVAIVSIGENIEASILIVMTLKELGIKNIIAKAVTSIHGKVLENLGVSKIIYPERDAGVRLANQLTSPNIIEYLALFPGYSIQEIAIPQSFIGKKLKELSIRSEYKINVIAIVVNGSHDIDDNKNSMGAGEQKSRSGHINFSPAAEDILGKDDLMVVIGKDTDIGNFQTDVQ